jgi:hypothetical protein
MKRILGTRQRLLKRVGKSTKRGLKMGAEEREEAQRRGGGGGGGVTKIRIVRVSLGGLAQETCFGFKVE